MVPYDTMFGAIWGHAAWAVHRLKCGTSSTAGVMIIKHVISLLFERY